MTPSTGLRTGFERVLVVAAGAVGGYYGARLCKAGARTTFVARGPHAEALREKGLVIEDADAPFAIAPGDPNYRVCTRIADAGPADLVLFAVKWRDCAAAAEDLARVLPANAAVLCLLNGVDAEDVLVRALGKERVVGGMTRIAASVPRPGVVQREAFGAITVGELDRRMSERTQAIADLFNAANVPADVVDDIWRAKWQKLVWNATFNSLNTITRRSVEELATDEETARLCRRAMREVALVGGAEGVEMSDVNEEMIENILAVTRLMGGAPTSMLQDLIAGRPLENEIMSGAIVRRARARGLDVPVQESFYAILRQLSPRGG